MPNIGPAIQGAPEQEALGRMFVSLFCSAILGGNCSVREPDLDSPNLHTAASPKSLPDVALLSTLQGGPGGGKEGHSA